MTPHRLVRPVCVLAALATILVVAPSAASAGGRGPLAGPTSLRATSFTYVIEASFGYRIGVPQTQNELHVDSRDVSR